MQKYNEEEKSKHWKWWRNLGEGKRLEMGSKHPGKTLSEIYESELTDTPVKDPVAEQGAKEKAKELIFKFMITPFTTQLPTATAKHYAILCVDEILKALPETLVRFSNDGGSYDEGNPEIEYWQQVRTRIINY